MRNSAALIIAQDCSPNALTVRGYTVLTAVGSPYFTGGREPTVIDALYAAYVLRGEIAATFKPNFLGKLESEANGFTDAQTAQLHADILTAIEPVTLALQGGIKGKASNKQSNGLTPALLLRCAKDYGWTIPATLDSPIATLLLTLREALVQAGKSITYGQMALIDEMKAAQEKAQAK